MQAVDWLGWGASAVLLATLGRQVLVQWRERSTEGVSSWLFRGATGRQYRLCDLQLAGGQLGVRHHQFGHPAHGIDRALGVSAQCAAGGFWHRSVRGGITDRVAAA